MPRPWARPASSAGPDTIDQPVGTGETRYDLGEILDRMTEGVVVLTGDLKPLLANSAARRLLGMPPDSLPGRLPTEEIVALAVKARAEGSEQEDSLKLFFPTTCTLHVRAAPLADASILVTLRDVTREILAQRVRKEFVSHASHELKSPVASMQALAEAVHKALEDDPDAASRFSERLVSESERLGRLVNDLLDLSRLEDAGSTPTESVDLSAVAYVEAEQIRELAVSKGLDFSSTLADGVWMLGDEQQIGLLVRNLLENAIRYTPENGTVTIEVAQTESEVLVAVTDDGIGISRDAQTRVFERFYRIDRARSRDRGGTGLGLAIVKHVAELHGGTVEVASDLGQGSTFTARFPRLKTDDRVRSIAG